MATKTIEYIPPPTIADFVKDHVPGQLFEDWIVGPVGSGKTTGIFMKLVYMAGLQAKGPDGIRRSRAVIVRNTAMQLKDTTLNSWFTWFKPGIAGDWQITNKTFILKYGDVECEVLFRPLDSPEDVSRVLSLEVTFAIVDEFVEIPRQIIEALAARCGRYPSIVEGGATNRGLWGSSNPSTEDNWWHDYLHNPVGVIQPGENISKHQRMVMDARSVRYFLQPSGFSTQAENIGNLPGGRSYYTDLAKNKSTAWIRQFIDAEWGFSVSGKPVIQSFRSDIHLSKRALPFDPMLPLVGGFDPGITGAAFIIGQETYDGALNVLGEIIAAGMGTRQLITTRLQPYLKARFPLLRPGGFIIAPDPASANRNSNDGAAVVNTLRMFYPVVIESNNRLPLRVDAIDHYANRMVMGQPALQIDEAQCPTLVRALKGGWRYKLDKNEDMAKATPEKNSFSHPGDGFGYLARYFHKATLRSERNPSTTPVRQVPNIYHFR